MTRPWCNEAVGPLSARVRVDDNERMEEEGDMSGYDGREVELQLEPLSCATSLCLSTHAFTSLDSCSELGSVFWVCSRVIQTYSVGCMCWLFVSCKA